MITCRRCGLVNGDGANYCDQCGSELVPIHTQTRAASFEDDAWYASHALRCIVIGLVAFAGVALMLVK